METEEIVESVVKTICPDKNDVIIMRYSLNQFPHKGFTQCDILNLWDSLKATFPNNKCMMIPFDCDIDKMDESAVRSVIAFLEETLQNR